MTNARSIIEQAARKITVLGRGINLSADEAQDGLTALNNMLGQFSIDGGIIFTQVRETFNLTGARSYTIGTGGNFNTERPIEIMAVYVSQGGIDYQVPQIGAAEYASILDKDAEGQPDYFYYDNNNPVGNIFLQPKPDASYTITIYSKKAITRFANLTTDYSLPDGYENMLVHNLAVVLAPEYEKEASPTVVKTARQTKTAVIGYNSRNNYPTSSLADVPSQTNNSGNIYNGYNQ